MDNHRMGFFVAKIQQTATASVVFDVYQIALHPKPLEFIHQI